MEEKQKIASNFSSNVPWFAIAAALLVSACWGGNFAASKFAMAHFPPFLTVLLRFVLLTVLLAPFALRQPMPRLRDMAVLSVLYITIHFALIFYAMWDGLNVTSAIIATQMGVPFSCLLAAIFFKDYLGSWRSFGLLVSFVGLLVVSGTPNVLEYWWPFMIAVTGSLSWGLANIYMKRMPPAGVIAMLFWPALLALPQMALLSALLESQQWQLVATAPVSAWLGVIYSAIFSSLVGYGLWMWLLKHYQMSQVVPYSLLTPLVGIASGVLVFHDPLTPLGVVGAALTVIGVAVITIRRPKLVELERA